MKPWKREQNTGRVVHEGCFNGATAMKPWKSTTVQATNVSHTNGFNGATAMKPWKSQRPGNCQRSSHSASMGPRR